jgi:hypothetical protein
MLGLNGFYMHAFLEERLAELKMFMQAKEPLHALAELLMACWFGDPLAISPRLAELMGSENLEDQIAWFEKVLLSSDVLRKSAGEVYARVEKEWQQAYEASGFVVNAGDGKHAEPAMKNASDVKRQTSDGDPLGGIDLNTDRLDMLIQGNAGNFDMELTPEQLQMLKEGVTGFAPVITGVKPLGSVSGFLGMKDVALSAS